MGGILCNWVMPEPGMLSLFLKWLKEVFFFSSCLGPVLGSNLASGKNLHFFAGETH